jgi:SAM-dependent methyltransferase
MPEQLAYRFSQGAGEWVAYNQGPLGRIRQEVTWHNLKRHLPERAEGESPLRVLDVGGGSGELMIKLVRRGCLVWLVDCAEGMLEQARQATLGLPTETRGNVTFLQMDAADVPDSFAPETFDAITCHTLVEYLPQPKPVLGALAGLLHPQGLLSISFVNRHAEVLRRVWGHGDPAGALQQLADGGFCATLFDVEGRAYTVDEVSGWMEEYGLASPAVYGVRAFADYVPGEQLSEPELFDALMQLEKTVADLRPYSTIARYIHLVAQKA